MSIKEGDMLFFLSGSTLKYEKLLEIEVGLGDIKTFIFSGGAIKYRNEIFRDVTDLVDDLLFKAITLRHEHILKDVDNHG